MDREERLSARISQLSGVSAGSKPPPAARPPRPLWDDPLRIINNTPAAPYFPPNRFSVSPGPRWDGLDRSNGFEVKLLQEANARAARRDTAYRHDHLDL